MHAVYMKTGFTMRSEEDETTGFVDYDECVINWLTFLKQNYPQIGFKIGTAAPVVSFSEEAVATAFRRLFG